MMLQKLLGNVLSTAEMADTEPSEVRFWAYLVTHMLIGVVLGMIGWKTMSWLLH